MKILSKYIFKEILLYFILSFSVLSLLFMSQHLYRIIRVVLEKDAPLLQIIIIFVLYFPASFTLTIPMGFLTGTLMALGRLSADSEIIVIRSCGVKLIKIVAPIFYFAFIITVFCLLSENFIVPIAKFKAENILFDISQKNPMTALEEKKITSYGDKIIYADKIDNKNNIMRNVIVIDKTENSKLLAETAIWITTKDQVKMILKNGSLEQLPNSEKLYKMHTGNFKKITINLTEKVNLNKTVIKSSDEMNYFELKNLISSGNFSDIKTLIRYYSRLVLPFSCLAFAFIAIPVGLTSKKNGKAIGFGFAILLVFLYYLLFTTAKLLANKEILQPSISLWIPNIIITIIGILLLRKKISKDL